MDENASQVPAHRPGPTCTPHAGAESGTGRTPRRGIAREAVRTLLDLARSDGRWCTVHAFPSRTNTASNAICRSAGFTFAGAEETAFAGSVFATNHWIHDFEPAGVSGEDA
ncbi:GNAT family N-acetyltransferase [Actinoplanes couchii]|uniref:N-acetyltransferase domain-containing protein n=1 Tax=Actinoplanes couchii TaxID=403638 RepID=A0ABQ3XL91_9ACTN|nr:hypothetical protein Aco03nite_076830 [Actinoplanes couchii]